MSLTDAQLRDMALAELHATTVGFINKKWTTPPAGTHWANAENILAQIGAVAPPPPPPPPPPPTSKVPVNIYVNPTGSSGFSYAQEWDHIVASGLPVPNGLIPGLDVATVKHVNRFDQWVNIYNGCSQSDAVTYGKQCYATGLVKGFIVWDEPSGSSQLGAAVSMAKAIKGALSSAQCVTTHYDPGMLTTISNQRMPDGSRVFDQVWMDAYPARTGWSLAVEKAGVAALEAAGQPYGIVLDAFSANQYPIPTKAQLQSEVDWAKSTRAVQLSIYAWGVAGGSPHLQDDAELMAVLKASL